jgi:NAD(P)-dependent dehydrogenase (short-subunit alcohol dehydrogenase family)
LSDIEGKRVLVVGASAGIGRAIGEGLAAAGATVVFAARRKDVVEKLAARAGGTALGVACDVGDELQCEETVERTVAALGGLDALVYAPAIIQFGRLADATAAMWEAVFRTNVTGAALITKYALPHLKATAGKAIYLSSTSASSTPPWTGLGLYTVSKAALDKLVAAWRADEPGVGFTRLVVGPTDGLRTAEDPVNAGLIVDPELMGTWQAAWLSHRYLTGALVTVDDVCRIVRTVLEADAEIDTLTIEAR